ncbi:hypothetical protein DPEC_G00135390 [Dallia pectoralis]|uniref:Uncharacterized protein n=1 Tax=Dallia pectoralis TaxID=75939 RepID=A0ACC2GLG8_DALPE|nr:hypothetical protein DPEC_G00135390 [Dallia pectoralis]
MDGASGSGSFPCGTQEKTVGGGCRGATGLTLPATRSSSDELSSSSSESSESEERSRLAVHLGRAHVRDTRRTSRGGPHPPRGLHNGTQPSKKV